MIIRCYIDKMNTLGVAPSVGKKSAPSAPSRAAERLGIPSRDHKPNWGGVRNTGWHGVRCGQNRFAQCSVLSLYVPAQDRIHSQQSEGIGRSRQMRHLHCLTEQIWQRCQPDPEKGSPAWRATPTSARKRSGVIGGLAEDGSARASDARGH